MQTRITILLLFFGILTVVGCGSNENNATGEQDDSIGYVGNTAPANITPSNATPLVARTNSSLHITQVISRGGQQSFQNNGSASGKLAPRARTVVDETAFCDSGSLEVDGVIEDDGSGQFILVYQNCRQGSATLHGEVTLQIGYFDHSSQLLYDATYNFISLNYASQSINVSLSGSFHSLLDPQNNSQELTVGSLISTDNTSNHMFMLSNTVITMTYDDLVTPTSYSQDIQGNLYDSEFGFVDITTYLPLSYSSLDQQFPYEGHYELSGASLGSIRVQVLPSPYNLFALDLDGDDLYETYAALSRDELIAGQPIVDTDGDGIHDNWEQINGFDPNDEADADLDSDVDTFSTLEEYLAGSDPHDNTSIPRVSDLTITAVATGDPYPGAVFSFEVQIQNGGNWSAENITATYALPAGAHLVSASGREWICENIAQVVTCKNGYRSYSNVFPLTIELLLPPVIGTVANRFSVTSDSVDTDLNNNGFTRDVDIDPVAPSERLIFDDEVFDFELDIARQLLYVSIPDQNAIAIVSLDSLSVVNRVAVGSGPQRIAISPDGGYLYIVLLHGRSVGELNLNTLALTEIPIAAELERFRPHDVIAPRTGEVFVTTSRGGSIAKIDTLNGNAVSRVTTNRSISSKGIFAPDEEKGLLYVMSTHGSNSMFKLDLMQPDLPVVQYNLGLEPRADDVHITLDGSRLLLSSGLVVSSDTLTEVGTIEQGASQVSSDGNNAVVGKAYNHIGVYDLSTYLETSNIYINCGFSEIERIIELVPDQQWLLLGQHTVCRVTAPDPAGPVPKVADLSIRTMASGDPVFGRTFEYVLTVENFGPLAAQNLTVTNKLPLGTHFVSVHGSDWSCNGNSNTTTCSYPDLVFGQAPPLTITAGAHSHTQGTNTASVASATSDSDLTNNTDIQIVNVRPEAASENLGFGSPLFDFELDTARQRVYASIPGADAIAVISLESFNVIGTIGVGPVPLGIDMSPDGQYLYAALSETGEVASVNLDTFSITKILAIYAMNTRKAYDVIAPRPNEIFVSPNDLYFNYVARIDLANGVQISRIESGKPIHTRPLFAAGLNPGFLYVRQLNNVFKLDLSQAGTPVVQEASPENITGPDPLAIDADGSRLLLTYGEVYRTDTLTPTGLIGYGPKIFSTNNLALVGEAPNRIGIYDLSTYLEIDKVYTNCNITEIERMIEVQPGLQWLLLGEQNICRVTR